MSGSRSKSCQTAGTVRAYLQSFGLGNLKSITNDARVQSFRNISVGLLQQLTDKENYRGSTISANIVLCSSGSGNHNGGRVLDLHFSQEDVSIFGKFDLYSTGISASSCSPEG